MTSAEASLSERLADGIVEIIRTERLGPGDALASSRELAQRFEVTTPTVREALRRLEATGIVEFRHGSGTYVGAGIERRLLANPHRLRTDRESVLRAGRGAAGAGALDRRGGRPPARPRRADRAGGAPRQRPAAAGRRPPTRRALPRRAGRRQRQPAAAGRPSRRCCTCARATRSRSGTATTTATRDHAEHVADRRGRARRRRRAAAAAHHEPPRVDPGRRQQARPSDDPIGSPR